MIKLGVGNIPTSLVPGTTGTTTTDFARFAASTTLRTYCSHVLGNRWQRTCRSWHVDMQLISVNAMSRWACKYTYSGSSRFQLTFTGPDALAPCVVEVWITDISTFLEPSTAWTAATCFAGHLGATLQTHFAHVLGDGPQLTRWC